MPTPTHQVLPTGSEAAEAHIGNLYFINLLTETERATGQPPLITLLMLLHQTDICMLTSNLVDLFVYLVIAKTRVSSYDDEGLGRGCRVTANTSQEAVNNQPS